MALISCPQCGSRISDKAASCPYCAFPLKNYFNPVKKRKSRIFVYISLILFFVVAAFVTKPDFNEHKNTIYYELISPKINKMGGKLGLGNLSSMNFLGINFSKDLTMGILDQSDITFNDYLLFSTVSYQGSTISIGLFSSVYIPQQVKKEIDNGLGF